MRSMCTSRRQRLQQRRAANEAVYESARCFFRKVDWACAWFYGFLLLLSIITNVYKQSKGLSDDDTLPATIGVDISGVIAKQIVEPPAEQVEQTAEPADQIEQLEEQAEPAPRIVTFYGNRPGSR